MFTTTDPKQISYDHGDYKASYEDNVIGWFNSYLEAEQALDAHASDLARQTACDTADMEALAAEQTQDEPALLKPPSQITCDAPGCNAMATHAITTTDPWTYTCCFHYSEEFTGTLCPCRTNRPVFHSPLTDAAEAIQRRDEALLATETVVPNLFDAYRAAYGWACVQLDDQFVADKAA